MTELKLTPLKDTLEFLKTLTSYFSWRTYFTTTLIILIGLTEGLAILLIVPLLNILGFNIGDGFLYQITDFIHRGFLVAGIEPSALSVLVLFLAGLITHEILFYYRLNTIGAIQYTFPNQMQKSFFSSLAKSEWSLISDRISTDYLHVLTKCFENLHNLTKYTLNILTHLIIIIFYLVLSFKMSVPLTSTACLIGIFLLGVNSLTFHKLNKKGEIITNESRQLYGEAESFLQCLKMIKSHGIEKSMISRFIKRTDSYQSAGLDLIKATANNELIFKIGSAITLTILLYISIVVAKLPSASIIFLVVLYLRIMPKIISTFQLMIDFIGALPGYSKIIELKKLFDSNTISEIKTPFFINNNEEIKLENISFFYGHDQNNIILGNYNLTIKTKTLTIIKGPSGCGKTTLVDLISGLLTPKGGRITIGDQTLTPQNKCLWQRYIGYVHQNISFINDTLWNNLTLGLDNISRSEVDSVLKETQSDQFIHKLPLKLDTVLGIEGINLSRGEKQRLSLTRALLRKPKLLILDETTNSLDLETEKLILRLIELLKKEMTVILITHLDLPSIKPDSILEFENGNLLDSKTLGFKHAN